ncbi:MAG: ABC transporter substrate-binding protein [Flavobacteriales bacterium]
MLSIGCSAPDTAVQKADWSTAPNAYAEHFELQVRGRDRRILVFGPNGRTDTTGILIVHGATEPGEVPLAHPLKRVAVVSTTHLPYFEALKASEVVVGVAHAAALRPGVFRDQVANGHTMEISRADGLDKERLIALAPQALFNYPFGRNDGSDEMNIPVVPITEYLEQHPLGRAEWIRFFGYLLGKEDKADSLFKAIEHRYLTLKGIGAALEDRPRVFFGSNWEKTWYAPPGNSYMATLINDAGDYLYSDSISDGNIAMPLERLLLASRGAEHFGVVLAAEGRVGALQLAGGDPRLAELDAVREGGFHGNSEHSDIFGQALLEPDIILRDLRCIFRPGTCPSHRPTYFFRVGQ